MNRIQKALERARGEVGLAEARRTAQTPPAAQPTTRPRGGNDIRRRRPIHVVPASVRDRERLKLGDEADATTQAYRVVRSRVLQWLDAERKQTVAIVSAAPDDGKTLSALNLAFCMAQDTNHTVLLVDLDLRAPSLHSRLGLEAERGLERFFRGDARIEDLIVPVASPRLAVLPCLEPVPGSSELLAGAVVRDLVTELRSRYADRVILFDLPPALLGDDALVFLPLVDAALVVVGDGVTRKDDLLRLAELMGDTPVIGSVLNRATSVPMQRYYR
jgi:Mrp family chromosome partitioning ATPase